MTIFIDIDGTLAEASARFREAGPEPDRVTDPAGYRKWLGLVQSPETLRNDPVVPGMQELIWLLARHHKCVYLTARDEVLRPATEQWLIENKFPLLFLKMRPSSNFQISADFKEQAILDVLKYDPSKAVMVLDDDYDGELAKRCRKHGWTFFKAMSGGVMELYE